MLYEESLSSKSFIALSLFNQAEPTVTISMDTTFFAHKTITNVVLQPSIRISYKGHSCSSMNLADLARIIF